MIGAASESALVERLRAVEKDAKAGRAPAPTPPAEADLQAPERLAIDYADAAELANKSAAALKALTANQPAVWKALRAQGIYRGRGPAPKVAFLYTGQGSQYVNMLELLRATEPIVAETFAEADRVMAPLLGKPLSDFIFVDHADPNAVAKAEDDLRQTAITQPAVLATDLALTRLLAAYGVEPNFTMGHSLGEYGALVAAGGLPFADSLEAVSARGRGMTQVAMDDNGRMAAVFAPLEEIERILKTINGNVVIANVNSNRQAVIGGGSKAVEQALEAFQKAGYDVAPLVVSHAFHTSIVAGASKPLREVLERLHLESPHLPIVANTNGEFYPMGPDVVPQMLEILTQQVASPVQFVKGLRTLYDAGARVFVEVGPKKALQGFAEDVLGDRGDVLAVFTNHPKVGDLVAFNQALCGLYAAGLGRGVAEARREEENLELKAEEKPEALPSTPPPVAPANGNSNGDRYSELGHLFADVLDRGYEIYRGKNPAPSDGTPVVITGAALGLPGTEHIFDDANIGRILRGEQFIDAIPTRLRRAMLDKHITRLVKSGNGEATFESIHNEADVIRLAARGNAFDLEKEFGVSAERVAALDRVTQLAIAAGLDALRDAGIPLVMRYKTTSKGTQLPDRWGLPDALRDETGVIFASAFPGYDSYADEMSRYYADHERREQLTLLEDLRARIETNGHANLANQTLAQEVDRRIADLRATLEKEPYVFERRFLLRVLAMGHSQFAEFIGARGPNTQINAACASTAQAVGLAQDWIGAGRCRRVVVISADDVTSDHMLEWFGAGFLATGAAATDDVVEDAAIPFDRRRHGLIIGMGAAALVVERADAARERGIHPICEVLSTVTANSAFHGTRLDVQHIGQVMEDLIAKAETRGISRHQIAPKTVFVSHETYTPARGGSASAEIHALRHVFGDTADQVVIANTKGFTGHAMATGIEDVVAVKALETGCVPPVANFKEVDPELGQLNLSKGGAYPIEYALHLGAGFGSQISMLLLHWVATKDGVRQNQNALGYAYRITDTNTWTSWLSQIAGHPVADLEVVRRTLRVPDLRVPDQRPAARVAESPAIAIRLTPSPKPVPAAVSATVAAPARSDAKLAPPAPREAVRPKVAAPVAAPASSESSPVSATAPGKDPVQARILALVVEKTGYPQDMLDLDLDLEADLGVDTVKQAELFAAIREIYNIPRDENRKLRDYPTLTHVIRFVYEKRPDLASVPAVKSKAVATATGVKPPAVNPSTPAPAVAHGEDVAGDSVKQRILTLVVEKTGYPEDMLDLDLDLEADLGVDTVKQAELFAAVREIYNIPRDENRKLREYPTLAHVIRFVYEKRPELANSCQASTRTASVTEAPKSEAVTSALPTPVAGPAPLSTSDSVKERVLALVVEKTGYPKDMLDLDLDLEADLGVDTVKQAELFAAIREIYSIPRDENRKLRDYPTLAHVIRFVFEKRPDLADVSMVSPAPTTKEEGKAASVPPNATTPVAVAETAATSDSIKEKVLDIVAQKTGYPKDMLDPDLDLEADLGIDTVKQAEMFAAIRAAYNIPRDENLKLRNFPTLAHVIKFAQDKSTLRGHLQKEKPGAGQKPATSASSTSASSTPARMPAKTPRPALASLDAANSIPRRVPLPVLRPPLNICKQTGVSLERGQRVMVMPDKGGVADALTQQLQKRGVEVLRIDGTPDAPGLADLLESWLAAGPVHGVYWLPALDHEGNLRDLDLATWHEAVRVRIKLLYTAMRTLYEPISKPGTFLISATRLGGQHGYDAAGALAPLGGAVTGFTKTYKRERMEAHVKAVDFEPECKAPQIAELLIEETLRDPGAIEIGYNAGLRWTIGLEEQSATDGQPGLILDENTVFLITGAAGSIVSAITADLAAASGGIFYLLDLVPEPDPANPDLKRFMSEVATEKESLKRDLFARIQARGERATPALVERELAALDRAQAALSAIEAVRAAGGTPHYFSVNLADAEAVAKVIKEVRERSGRIDVLLHAAGIERSRSLSEKEPGEFDLVFSVKGDGFFNLLHAIGDMPLGATVAFSSIAGRFGNPGQTDYSSANDLLCKITSSFRTTRPGTRGIAIDWTAWGGIGMATRGSIPKVMEQAGIDMLPPEAAVPLIRRELTAGGTRGEVVIGQRLGVLLKEWDESGGIDKAAVQPFPEEAAAGPMTKTGKIASAGLFSPLIIETTLDPKIQPFLHDHQIDGTPVLPGVMGIEAFAEAALQMLPGWHIEAIEDVNFLVPFKFYRHEPRTVIVECATHPHGSGLVANCRLIGHRSLPNQAEPQTTTHFTARVRFTKRPAEGVIVPAPISPPEHTIEAADIYRLYFHGPAYQVLERAWWDGDRMIGLMARNLPGNHHPSELPTLMEPRLIELCFQTAGIWQMGTLDQMGLPQHVDRAFLLRTPTANTRLYAVVTPDPVRGTFDANVVDEMGARYVQLTGYRTIASPNLVNAEQLKALRDVMSSEPVPA